MREQWFIASKKADFEAISKKYHISPVLARLMRNRDVMSEKDMKEYLYGTLQDLYDPYLLKDGEKAAKIIKEKIIEKKKIRIISDYDVDGVSSNYILYRGLKRCGALVDYKIPDRIQDGYGINENLISQAHEDGIDTIVTCDNGIAASEQIEYGNTLGITFVITDHHEVPFEEGSEGRIYHIPKAAAVVNPKRPDCGYPFKSICGAVVVYKFIQILYNLCDIDGKETEEFLEIAAMATVCDVMPLQNENRIIVKEGLKRMNHTSIKGLHALMAENQLLDKKITGYHLGFILGPCINASGRLSSAKDALELLLCEDDAVCQEKAKTLTDLNKERKEMTKKGEEDAHEYLQNTGHASDKVLIIFLPDCHESLAGIIAGRVRECYNKPVFVLTRTKDGHVKGSGRSIEPYSMFEEMSKVKECFEKFGGHPMAAGLSMAEEKIEELRTKLNANTSLTQEDFVERVHIDIAVPVSYLSEDFLKELDVMEPFGTANAKPLFAQKNLHINGYRVLGNTGRCLKMNLADMDGNQMEAIYFGDVNQMFANMEESCDKVQYDNLKKGKRHSILLDCTYYPEINEWRGNRTMQIIIKNYRFR